MLEGNKCNEKNERKKVGRRNFRSTGDWKTCYCKLSKVLEGRSLIEKVTFVQRLAVNERVSHVGISVKSIVGRQNTKFQGPEATAYPACLKNSKEISSWSKEDKGRVITSNFMQCHPCKQLPGL